MVRELGLGSNVTFTGMLTGDLKRSAQAASSIFVLPSYSEGFSVAVLEALALGIPVIVTNRCNISEVARWGCGWVIEPEEKALEIALTEALQAPEAPLKAMGEWGRSLVSQHYTWDVVGRQMAAVYDWVLGGTMPSNVEIVT